MCHTTFWNLKYIAKTVGTISEYIQPRMAQNTHHYLVHTENTRNMHNGTLWQHSQCISKYMPLSIIVGLTHCTTCIWHNTHITHRIHTQYTEHTRNIMAQYTYICISIHTERNGNMLHAKVVRHLCVFGWRIHRIHREYANK